MPDVHALPGLWTPIKGYDPLVERLRGLGYRDRTDGTPANLVLFPYDWRLSNRYNGSRLAETVGPALGRWREQGGPYADARVVLVVHSMGGLVARWYVERCGGAEVTRKLITLGTPYRGAAKALEQLVNGVKVGKGPVSVDLEALGRSLPSMHQLLPEYACVQTAEGLRSLREVVPGRLDAAMVADALAFHGDLAAAEAARPGSRDSTHAIIGARQPTWTTVELDSATERVVALETIDGDEDFGDATVPLAGSLPGAERQDSNRVRRVVDQHGNLQRNPAALDEVEEVLTAVPVRRRDTQRVAARVSVPDYVVHGQALPVEVALDESAQRVGLLVEVADDGGRVLASRQPPVRDGRVETTFQDLPPGAHTVTVRGTSPASLVTTVTATALVVPPLG